MEIEPCSRYAKTALGHWGNVYRLVVAMNILGVSALYHDSAASLVKDGEIIAAAQEERFSRLKHDPRIPVQAIEYCLRQGELKPADLEAVFFYDNPLLTLDRYMKNVLALKGDADKLIQRDWDDVFSRRVWIQELLASVIPSLKTYTRFYVVKHHISHAASAFFPSPYSRAVILTLDGVGEWTTLSIGVGEGSAINIKKELRYPHSLGLLYSAFTYFCGFKVNSGDYKFMGLAPYGKPIYYDLLREKIVDVKDDGSFRLNLDYFDYWRGDKMINESALAELFHGGRREPESRITKREMDIAASVQKLTEEIILKTAQTAKSEYGANINNLVMAGGVALNCVANGKLLKSGIFENIWLQPAAGDAGGALGAALYGYYHLTGAERRVDGVTDGQKGSYLGIGFSAIEIVDYLEDKNYPYHTVDDIPSVVAKLLDKQKVIGLFQGRMEYGPRALGNRSIIADPRSKDMQSRLNLKIKYRESFRPFAPSVLKERVQDYFELETASPYMLLCADVNSKLRLPFALEENLVSADMDMLAVVNKERSTIPAVTHVDYSARIQTVSAEGNPRYYAIIKAFERLTGCGVVVNTSFNLRGEPIVCTPDDAYRCFMRSDMDVLVLENCILYKEEQPSWSEETDWQNVFTLD